MKGTAVAITLAVILAGITAVPLPGVAQSGAVIGAGDGVLQTSNDDGAANETPPGARLAGAVGAQEAEVRGEVESRSFGVALERADSDGARSRVVAERVDELRDRLDELRERKRDLQRAHRNGSIAAPTYAAELTALTARTESIRGQANQSRAAARGLPPDVAERNGVNVTAIRTLERDAANMTGPEVARIARSIAGPDVGRPVSVGSSVDAAANGSIGLPGDVSVGPPGDRGGATNRSTGPNGTGGVDVVPDDVENVTDTVEDVTDAVENATDPGETVPDGAGNASGGAENASDDAQNASERAAAAVDRAEERVTDAAARIDDAAVVGNETALADAEAALDDARDDLEAARSALDDGDPETARRLAERAIERVQRAEGLVDGALGGLGG